MSSRTKQSLPPRKKKRPIDSDEVEVLRYLVKTTFNNNKSAGTSLKEVTFGNIHIDFVRHTLLKNDKKVSVRELELRLLKYLILHEGEVLSRDQLLKDVWGFASNPTTRTVDNYILRLRKIIEADPAKPRHIVTLHSAGYQFNR